MTISWQQQINKSLSGSDSVHPPLSEEYQRQAKEVHHYRNLSWPWPQWPGFLKKQNAFSDTQPTQMKQLQPPVINEAS